MFILQKQLRSLQHPPMQNCRMQTKILHRADLHNQQDLPYQPDRRYQPDQHYQVPSITTSNLPVFAKA